MIVQQEVFSKPCELIQGILPDNQHFLFSNKSSKSLKSTTTIKNEMSSNSRKLHKKACEAEDLFLSLIHYDVNLKDYSIIQENNIPFGKGLSSSSADILGILRALSVYFKYSLSNTDLYRLACSIEPSDPCLDSENIIFDQLKGQVLKFLPLLPFDILYFDSEPAKKVDTMQMRSHIEYSKDQKTLFREIHDIAIKAFEEKDYTALFYCSEKSALINESFLPKYKMSKFIDFAKAHNCGIFVAHTGTYMGLIIPPGREEAFFTEAKYYISKHWNSLIEQER